MTQARNFDADHLYPDIRTGEPTPDLIAAFGRIGAQIIEDDLPNPGQNHTSEDHARLARLMLGGLDDDRLSRVMRVPDDYAPEDHQPHAGRHAQTRTTGESSSPDAFLLKMIEYYDEGLISWDRVATYSNGADLRDPGADIIEFPGA